MFYELYSTGSILNVKQGVAAKQKDYKTATPYPFHYGETEGERGGKLSLQFC